MTEQKVRERPIKVKTKGPPHGCFRAGVSRPWRWKGGKIEAQKRYRENHKEELAIRHKAEYERNKYRYRATRKIYQDNNRKTIYAYNREWGKKFRAEVRKEMIVSYGAKCMCCGEKEPIFLELDHINNDGNIKRKFYKNQFQEWLFLREHNWPKENHQLLCANCNKGKAKNGGICPHKKKDL